MKTVSPEAERSCTTPAKPPAAAVRMGTTKRPFRTVTYCSPMTLPMSGSRTMPRRRASISPRSSRVTARAAASVGLASSRTCPVSSSAAPSG